MRVKLILALHVTRILAGDSAYSIYDSQCRCTFNCAYCAVPSILTSGLKTSSGRGICNDPQQQQQPPANLAWTTISSPNDQAASGYCRTAQGGRGTHMTFQEAPALTQQECENLCAINAACVAYESTSTYCQLHSETPATIEEKAGAICRVKALDQLGQPPLVSSCCPAFEAQIAYATTTALKLRVRATPFVPRKRVRLQLPGTVINDPAVQISLSNAKFAEDTSQQTPPPAAGDDINAPTPGQQGRRLGGSSGASRTMDGATLSAPGILLELDDRDWDNFEVLIRYTEGALAPTPPGQGQQPAQPAPGQGQQPVQRMRQLGSTSGTKVDVNVNVQITCEGGMSTPSPPSSPLPPGLPAPPPLNGIIDDEGDNLGVGQFPWIVVVTFDAAGAVESYTAQQRAAIANRFAAAARVPVSQVSVEISPGSVEVEVRIPKRTRDEAYQTKAELEAQMGSKEAASSFSGLPVENTPRVRVEETNTSWFYHFIAFLLLFLLACLCLSPACFMYGVRHEHKRRRSSLAVADHGSASLDHMHEDDQLVRVPTGRKSSTSKPPAPSDDEDNEDDNKEGIRPPRRKEMPKLQAQGRSSGSSMRMSGADKAGASTSEIGLEELSKGSQDDSESTRDSTTDSVRDSVTDSVRDSVRDSTRIAT